MTVPLRPAGVIARYVLLGAACGVLVAAIWVWSAPRVLVTSLNGPAFVDPYPQGFAESDLILGSLLLAAGCGIGVVGAVRLRRTGFAAGWVHVVGAIAAAGMCAAVARVGGWWVAGRAAGALPGGRFELPLTVRAGGVLLLAAFAALLVIVLFAAFAREPATPGSAPAGH